MGPGGGRGPGARDVDPNSRPAIGKVLRRFWPFIRPYRWAIIAGTLCVVLATILQKVRPLIMRFIVDRVLTPFLGGEYDADLYATSLRLLVFAVWGMLVIAGLGAVISRFRMFIMQRAGASMVVDMRLFVYRHLQRLSLSYYESRQTGEIMSRVVGDVGSMEQLVTHVSDHVLTDILNLVVTIAILFALSCRLALVALIPVPFLMVIIWRFSGKIRPVYREVRDRMGKMTAKLQDNIAGIRVIKAFHTEGEESDRFERENREYYDMQIKGMRLWTTAFPLVRFVQGTGHILVTGVGGYMLLQPEPSISLGDLFAFNAYVIGLYGPIGSLFRIYNTILRSVAAGERVIEVLDSEPDVEDAADAVELPPVKGKVRMASVSFEYRDGERVLEDVTIEAAPGEVVALVGRSGAGKTTIVNLIPRFYDPTEGHIEIDGIDVRHVTQQSLRRQIAIVLQDAFLFNGTVLDNIRYSRSDATDEEVRAAAEAAFATEFIDKLPKGYETEIGERGVKLSGGQRQRISIARALLADRRILILDEATSMVDSEAEYLIQQALGRLMQGRTTFVIAHRLSTIRKADKIVALENGRVVECGDHETLLARNGAYAQMYQAQFRLALEDDDTETPGKISPGPGLVAGNGVPDLPLGSDDGGGGLLG